MNYQLLSKAINRIYHAEVLSVIAFVFTFITASLTIFSIEYSPVLALLGIISILVTAILKTIAFFMTFSGVNLAAKQHSAFKKVRAWLCIGIACAVAQTVLTNVNEAIAAFMSIAEEMCMLISIYMIMASTVRIADEMQDYALRKEEMNTSRVVLRMLLLSILMSTMSTTLEIMEIMNFPAAPWIAFGLTVFVAGITFTALLKYLKTLRQMRLALDKKAAETREQ